MKAIIGLSSVLLVLSATALGQGWEWRYPLVNGNFIRCIGSFDNGTVWASTEYGDILWSTDSGQTWAVRNALDGPKSEVVFIDELHGWGIDGQYGQYWDTDSLEIYYTSDGGYNWIVQYSQPVQYEAHLSDIEFVDSQNGWVMGYQNDPDYCIQLHTDDGGDTWYDESVEGYDCPEKVNFINAQEGWATHNFGGGPLWHTTNGGFTWDEILSTCPAYGVKFLDELHGWGLGGDVLRTTDGGLNWTAQGLDYNGWSPSSVLQCVSDSIVLAGGSSARFYRTTDAGAHWTFHDFTNFGLNAIHFVDAQHGWVAGSRGTILHASDGIDQWELQNGSLGLYVPSEDVDFVDLNHGWAIGWTGGRYGIMFTSDAGFTWTIQDTAVSAEFTPSIEAVDSLHAWVSGSYHGALRTTDGGASWTLVEPCSCYVAEPHWWRVLRMAHYGPNDLWAIGHGLYYECGQVISKSTDGGQTWNCYELSNWLPGYPYGGMVFVDENNGWISGGNDEGLYGFISHTSDGGLTWETQYTHGESDLSVSFVDPLHGWGCGWGILLRTENGGQNWESLPPPAYVLRQVQFFDTLHGWVLSDQNMSFRTSDGGQTWQEVPAPLYSYQDAMDFVDFDHGWLVGRGAVIYYDGTPSASPRHARNLPQHFSFSTYPNPFNPVTTLSFDLPASAKVRLRVYDLTGRLVETLADRMYAAGEYSLVWNAEGLPSGMYFCRVEATPLSPPVNGGRWEQTKKMVVLK